MRILSTLALFVLAASPLGAQQYFNVGAEVNGQINVQINTTLNDGIGDHQPVAGLLLTLYRSATDSLQLTTDDAGVLKFAIAPGSYRLSSVRSVPWHGRSYHWNVPLPVRRGMGIVNLTVENATITGAAATAGPPPRIERRQGESARVVREVGNDGSAGAQDPEGGSSTKGFILGLHANASAITTDESDDNSLSGPGGGLMLGYGFTPQLALVTDLTVAVIDNAGEREGLAHFDLLLRYAFTSPTRRFVPFIEGGVSGIALAQNDVDLGDGTTGDVSVRGAGLTLGAGAYYHLSPTWALGAELKVTRGELDTVTIENVSVNDLGVDMTSARLNVGFTWFPGARR
jgi:hypothetical protein